MAEPLSSHADDARQALELARRLARWGDARAWRGTDPYEGLSASRRLVAPLKRMALGRRLLIQAVKRSPIDLRPTLRIQPKADAASVAWAVSAFSRNGFLNPVEAQRMLGRALDLLDRLRSPGYHEPCWGYHFDFQSRVFFYKRGEPNTIATAFAGHALLDAYQATGEGRLLEMARGTGHFFIRYVPVTDAGSGSYFGYLPDDRSPIHNSNLLVASLLARLTTCGQDDEGFGPAAEAAVTYTTTRQRPDGSWPYGERRNLAWVDNFHTGYVLDALRICADAGIGGPEADRAWSSGMRFYAERMFTPDGAPKYYSTSLFPIDAQAVAQGIQTLSIAARRDESFVPAAWSVFGFALQRMLGDDGLPLFQRRRLWSNGAAHVRWVIAPMLLALTHLLALDGAPSSVRRHPEEVAA
jgi:hypothetical protein